MVQSWLPLVLRIELNARVNHSTDFPKNCLPFGASSDRRGRVHLPIGPAICGILLKEYFSAAAENSHCNTRTVGVERSHTSNGAGPTKEQGNGYHENRTDRSRIRVHEG